MGDRKFAIEATDLLERPVWYKFFTNQGEIFSEEGSLFFISQSTGQSQVTAFVITENGLVDV